MESPILQVAITGDRLLEAGGAVPLFNGLNVLYGLNGAGKSRFLQGLRCALRGVGSDSGLSLLVRATSDAHATARYDFDLQRSVTSVLAKAVADREDFTYYQKGKPASQQQIAPRKAVEVLNTYLIGLLPPSGEARDWALANRLFLLKPVGTESAPQWLAWAVADPSEAWVQRETEVLDAAWQRMNDDYGDDDDENEAVQERYQEVVSAHTVFSSNDLEVDGPGSHIFWLGPFSPLGYRYEQALFVEPLIIDGPVDFEIDLVDYDRPVGGVTADFLRETIGHAESRDILRSGDETTQNPELIATNAAENLSQRVTSLLQGVLVDGPFATLELTEASERLFSPAFEWRFSRQRGRFGRLSAANLSRAEGLWADRSIIEAVHRHQRGGSARLSLYLYDEPEAALHRAAESNMATELLERARDPKITIVAATHSPELLDAPSANVIEVRRSASRSTVQELDAASRDHLDALGLNPSDLLRLTRIFLLVEGLHDEVLLEHFLGERLRRARVRMLPIRGGKKLAGTVDSRVLFDFTSAHLVAVLDNTRLENVSEVWARAQDAAVRGDLPLARRFVEDEIRDDGGESGYLRSWLRRALDYGHSSRMTPLGLGAPDIIEYLPVQRLVPRATSWGELHEQHRAELETSSKTPRAFKDWLTRRFKVRFAQEDLVKYAEGVPVPQDFGRLMKSIEAISADR